MRIFTFSINISMFNMLHISVKFTELGIHSCIRKVLLSFIVDFVYYKSTHFILLFKVKSSSVNIVYVILLLKVILFEVYRL